MQRWRVPLLVANFVLLACVPGGWMHACIQRMCAACMHQHTRVSTGQKVQVLQQLADRLARLQDDSKRQGQGGSSKPQPQGLDLVTPSLKGRPGR
jgi:hypothetical protein